MDKLTLLSREDEFVNFPTEPTDMDRIASQELLDSLGEYNPAAHTQEGASIPALGRENGLSLADLRGADYYDGAWDSLLDQMSVNDMTELVLTGGFGTAGIDSVGKPRTLDNDGPQALKYGDWAGTPGEGEVALNAYPSQTVIAQTWNLALCREWGRMVGEEGLAYRTTGWYAPGLNLHRSPFGGRNFEYFSEDPYLSGKMGAAVISGAAEMGLLCYPKHFAVNEQESYRSGWKYNTYNSLFTWATEQTMRELYLRSFEIVVKEATVSVSYIADGDGTVGQTRMRAAMGMMSGLNAIGSVWTGCDDALLQRILRDEWGFRGTVITDYRSPSRTYMNVDRMIRGGGDLVLYPHGTELADSSSATALTCLREACHNILYSYSNSNAMQGVAPGASISYTLSPWQKGIIFMWCCSAGTIAAGGMAVLIMWRVSKHMQSRGAQAKGRRR